MARQRIRTPTRLSSVTALKDYCLFLKFCDGTSGTVGLKDLIFSYPGLAPLRDHSAFARATLAEYGWEVEWPRYDVQIGADTLFADLLDQNAKTPAEKFTAWRIRNGLSLAAASRELGITTRTVSAYGSGARPIPRTVELACIGWEEEQRRKLDLTSKQLVSN